MADTLLLIHGFAFDNRIWNPVEIAFEGLNTVMFSLPGFDGQPVPAPYTIVELAERFWRDLDQQGVGRVHLAGHSMGGYTVMEMAAQQPDRVLSVALIHSHVFADSEEKRKARSVAIGDIKANGRTTYIQNMIPSLFANPVTMGAVIDALTARAMTREDATWYHGLYALRERNDHTMTLQQLKVPVLMLMGERDGAVPLDWALKQAPIAERTTFHLYANSGHMAMYENTLQMIRDLNGFYRQFQS
jgi:pimeloyl-ACP methyl ester carboxylesterase